MFSSEAEIQGLHTRIKNMRDHQSKLIESMNGSIIYLCGCVEKLSNQTTEIQNKLQALDDRAMAERLLQEPHSFPLSSVAEVNKYLSEDPKCEAMLNR